MSYVSVLGKILKLQALDLLSDSVCLYHICFLGSLPQSYLELFFTPMEAAFVDFETKFEKITLQLFVKITKM